MKMMDVVHKFSTGFVLVLYVLVAVGCTAISYPRDRLSTNTVLDAELSGMTANTTYTVLGPGSGNHCESGFRVALLPSRVSGVSLLKAFDQVLKSKNADWLADAVVERKMTVTSFAIFETYEECIEVRGLAIKFAAK